MMIEACRDFLISKLKMVMGEQTQVFTTMKALMASSESHLAAVIIASDKSVFNGSKINKKTAGNGRSTKLYDREITFKVVLSEYNHQELDQYYQSFIALLPPYIPLPNGFAAYLEIGSAEWIEKADSVIRAEISVELPIIFKGGIYSDHTLITLKELKLTQEGSDDR